MAQSDKIAKIKKTGLAALSVLSRHGDFVARVFAEYELASGGGKVNVCAATIQREIEYLDPIIMDPYDFAGLPENSLTKKTKADLLTQHALLQELKPFYDPKGDHRRLLKEELAGEHGLTKSEATEIAQSAGRIRTAISDYERALKDAGLFDRKSDQKADSTKTKPAKTVVRTAARVKDHTSKGDGKMPQDNAKDHALDGIVDAISRLQGQGGPGGFGTGSDGNVYNAFDIALDQRLQLTLGIPSLTSDSALAMDREDLTTKLFDGLDRTVAETQYGGVSMYSFNPLLARGGMIGVEDFALGAQAIAAETIRNLKPVFMNNVYKLTSETVIGDQEEAQDLRIAIEEGLDKLAAEAGAEMGIYGAWASEIIDTIFRDLMSLADLYDIREPRRYANRPLRRLNYADIHFSDYINKDVGAILEAISFNPAKVRTLAEPDIGILTAESNDRALIALLSKLMLMANLVFGGTDLGPLLGRVRVLNNTIASSVISARSALAAAGVSESDQAVHYNTSGRNSIDLRRLLSWIETESLTTRPVLLRVDLNPSDLRRVLSARQTQATALSDIIKANFPTVNNNRYAHGRRQLAEVEQHLWNLVKMLTSLIDESADDNQKAAG